MTLLSLDANQLIHLFIPELPVLFNYIFLLPLIVFYTINHIYYNVNNFVKELFHYL